MSILNKSMYMRISLNGKNATLYGQLSVAEQLKVLIGRINDLKSHGLSSLTVEFKSQPFTNEPAGESNDDLMASLYALAEKPSPDDPVLIETTQGNMSDPTFLEYLSLHSLGARERTTPDRLHFLRQYVEKTYPDFYRQHGHHF